MCVVTFYQIGDTLDNTETFCGLRSGVRGISEEERWLGCGRDTKTTHTRMDMDTFLLLNEINISIHKERLEEEREEVEESIQKPAKG